MLRKDSKQDDMRGPLAHVLAAALVLICGVSACSESADSVPPVSTTAVDQITTTGTPTTAAAEKPPTTTAPRPLTPTSRPAPQWERPTICEGPCDPPLEILFTVPVGDDGIGYADIDREEMLGWGPSSFTIAAEGNVWIVDQVHNRLLAFTLEGAPVATIDLNDYEVASALDIATGPDGLLLLDIYVATQRYRLLQLDHDGGFETVHELPAGLHLEDGLTGVATGPSGELCVELEVGTRVAQLDITGETVQFTTTRGYPYPGRLFGPDPTNTFAYHAGDVQIDVTTNAELGGLTFLGINPDGSLLLVLDEVGIEGDAFRVDKSVHVFDEDGNHLGAARFPFDQQFIELEHALAVGPDGNTYGLLTRPDHVAVARLPYSTMP
jgi:hypothetical protein